MKDYILLRAADIEGIEGESLLILDANKETPNSNECIKARERLVIIGWIRERNVYTMSLPSDNKFEGKK